MSAPPTHPEETDFEVIQEDDAVAARTIGVVLTTAVGVTVLAVSVAAWTLSATRSGLPWHEQVSAKVAPRQIARIHQTPIERDRHGWELREQQRRELEKYRWIDHDGGIAQIPIDRAIEIVIDDAAKANRNGSAP